MGGQKKGQLGWARHTFLIQGTTQEPASLALEFEASDACEGSRPKLLVSCLRPFSRLSQLARLAAVIALCLATPAVLDIIVQTSGWLSGEDCCADDCEESGEPCTQQCVHCVCGGHNVTLPSTERTLIVARIPPASLNEDRAEARSGHLDPPFRPPVS
jgi:hypothetical protein